MYFKDLRNEFPKSTQQELMRIAGKRWRQTPSQLKNSFTMYADEEKAIRDSARSIPSLPQPPPLYIHNSREEEEEREEEKKNQKEMDEDDPFYKYINKNSYA
jgi:hypothetical protein